MEGDYIITNITSGLSFRLSTDNNIEIRRNGNWHECSTILTKELLGKWYVEEIGYDVEELLRKLDVEIGSTVTYAHDKERVIANMVNVIRILDRLKKLLNV